MAWLQKRPQVSNPSLFYTVGLQKTLLLVGLGNIGSKYELTRHNVGFMALDQFVRDNADLSPWMEKKDLHCHFSSGQLGQARVFVIKPTTNMNLSGNAVEAVRNFYKISPENIVVIHDELDIAFGQIRLRVGGSSAGHNGIKSISEAIGEDYGRIRVGIGPKKPAKMDSADFVLQKFSEDEQKQLANMKREVSVILSEYVFSSEPLRNETRSFLL